MIVSYQYYSQHGCLELDVGVIVRHCIVALHAEHVQANEVLLLVGFGPRHVALFPQRSLHKPNILLHPRRSQPPPHPIFSNSYKDPLFLDL